MRQQPVSAWHCGEPFLLNPAVSAALATGQIALNTVCLVGQVHSTSRRSWALEQQTDGWTVVTSLHVTRSHSRHCLPLSLGSWCHHCDMCAAALDPAVAACRSLVTVVLGAVMMFLTSWKLALLTCATLPFMLLQFRAFARKHRAGAMYSLALRAKAAHRIYIHMQPSRSHVHGPPTCLAYSLSQQLLQDTSPASQWAVSSVIVPLLLLYQA